jgi:hypothetical protein
MLGVSTYLVAHKLATADFNKCNFFTKWLNVGAVLE